MISKSSLILSALVLLAACGTKPEKKQGPVAISATVGMIADIVSEVAGDHAIVKGIIGTGIDPHLYKPTRNDLIRLNASEVIFYNGLKLEGKMGDVLAKLSESGKKVFVVTETVGEEEGYVMADEEEHSDPHVWMDVKGWMKAVEVVAAKLASTYPEHAQDFETNAAALLAKMKELDAYALTSIASIPESQRVLVTAHDAFSYMGRAYDLKVRGIQGLSTESEAGVRDIENLVNDLVSLNIPAVFVESSVADKNVKALVEGCKARGHDVRIGGELYSDAMGPAGSYEGTYIGMIDHNVTTITRALGGSAPEGGMQGKLSVGHP